VLDEIGGDLFLGPDGTEGQGGVQRPLLVRSGDIAVFHHSFQDVTLALPGPVEMGEGGIGAGGLGEACQHCRLREGEMTGALPEIPLGGRLHAIGPMTEVDVIQIEVEDLLLGQVAVDLIGQDGLLDLADITLFRG